MWELARRVRGAECDTAYFYLLWCREFAQTSVVATVDNQVVGFVLGYLRQDVPGTLVVWQVGSDPSCPVFGVRSRMLNEIIDRQVARGCRFVETTVTAREVETIRGVRRLAGQRAARVAKQVLFEADRFPDGHAAEMVYIIGPLEAVRH